MLNVLTILLLRTIIFHESATLDIQISSPVAPPFLLIFAVLPKTSLSLLTTSFSFYFSRIHPTLPHITFSYFPAKKTIRYKNDFRNTPELYYMIGWNNETGTLRSRPNIQTPLYRSLAIDEHLSLSFHQNPIHSLLPPLHRLS